MRPAAQALILLALATPAIAADVVVPIDSVQKHINVRMEANAKTEIVGRLPQGESLPFVRTVSGWHEVRLQDDAYGYTSADWSQVISEETFSARQQAAAESLAEAVIEEDSQDEKQQEVVPSVVADIVQSESVDTEDASAVATEMVEPEPTDAGESDEVAEADDSADVAVSNKNTDATETAAKQVEVPQADAVDASENTVALVEPVVNTVDELIGAPGPAGPAGQQGPPGPPGVATVKGTTDFLMKFTDSTAGGNSQVFDDGRNVGIGTTQPKQRLEVNGNIQIHERNSSIAALMLTQASGEMGYIMHNRSNTLTLGAGSVDRLTIDGDGNVGIGMSRPSHPIEMASGAYVSAGGVWTNSSSREKKENIVALTPGEALAALAGLRPVRFNYKQDDTEDYVGFIAEDVPSLVASSDRASLSSMDIVAVLTLVVQQQQQKIAELEKRLDASIALSR